VDLTALWRTILGAGKEKEALRGQAFVCGAIG